ncbi:hypothetical protein SLA2020_277510 [Shorea laevis]
MIRAAGFRRGNGCGWLFRRGTFSVARPAMCARRAECTLPGEGDMRGCRTRGGIVGGSAFVRCRSFLYGRGAAPRSSSQSVVRLNRF